MSARIFRITLVLALLAMALPIFCQLPAPSYLTVSRMQVKIDRVTECQDLMKQMVAPYKKAAPADQYRIVYSTTVGNLFEYWSYSPMNKFADRDGASYFSTISKPEERATILARLMQYVEHVQTSIERPISDLSVISSGAKFPPTFLRVSRIYVRPETANDFINLEKTDVVPVLKKINGSVHLVQQIVAGGNPNTFLLYGGFEKWAELDDTTTFVNAIGGEQAVQKLIGKMSQLGTLTERYFLRYEPDLSYVPAPR
jgi:hypothetical protein